MLNKYLFRLHGQWQFILQCIPPYDFNLNFIWIKHLITTCIEKSLNIFLLHGIMIPFVLIILIKAGNHSINYMWAMTFQLFGLCWIVFNTCWICFFYHPALTEQASGQHMGPGDSVIRSINIYHKVLVTKHIVSPYTD